MPRKIITIQDCQALAEERNGKCLSTIFVDTGSNLMWECSKEHRWPANYRNVKHNKTWCPYCSGKARKTIQDCRDLAETKKGKFLSEEYRDNKTLYDWECQFGHSFQMNYNDVQQGHW